MSAATEQALCLSPLQLQHLGSAQYLYTAPDVPSALPSVLAFQTHVGRCRRCRHRLYGRDARQSSTTLNGEDRGRSPDDHLPIPRSESCRRAARPTHHPVDGGAAIVAVGVRARSTLLAPPEDAHLAKS